MCHRAQEQQYKGESLATHSVTTAYFITYVHTHAKLFDT